MVVDTESLQQTEGRRQRALAGLGILDSGPEARFDRVTRLDQQLFGVPMVSITLIDGDRQWRKSHLGLTTEAPREGAFCDVTVQQDAPLIVASIDPCYSCTDRVTLVDVNKGRATTVPYKEIERYGRERTDSPLK